MLALPPPSSLAPPFSAHRCGYSKAWREAIIVGACLLALSSPCLAGQRWAVIVAVQAAPGQPSLAPLRFGFEESEIEASALASPEGALALAFDEPRASSVSAPLASGASLRRVKGLGALVNQPPGQRLGLPVALRRQGALHYRSLPLDGTRLELARQDGSLIQAWVEPETAKGTKPKR